MSVQQSDQFVNLDGWNITATDDTFEIIIENNQAKAWKSTASGLNSKGMVNKNSVTWASGWVVRWTFVCYGSPSDTDLYFRVGASKSSSLSTSGSLSAYFEIRNTGGSNTTISANDNGNVYGVGGLNMPDAITDGSLYEVRLVHNQDGSFDYNVRGGTEFPNFTTLHTRASTTQFADATIYGSFNVERLEVATEPYVLLDNFDIAESEDDILPINEGTSYSPTSSRMVAMGSF